MLKELSVLSDIEICCQRNLWSIHTIVVNLFYWPAEFLLIYLVFVG
jgi:hypothetical protein